MRLQRAQRVDHTPQPDPGPTCYLLLQLLQGRIATTERLMVFDVCGHVRLGWRIWPWGLSAGGGSVTIRCQRVLQYQLLVGLIT